MIVYVYIWMVLVDVYEYVAVHNCNFLITVIIISSITIISRVVSAVIDFRTVVGTTSKK